ncbi:hypothetical protein GF358_01220 [Candidatus Woesearchaeota archaeon]|nr:hypothetical protein [Candidatus Woesearchaeota archaeon]
MNTHISDLVVLVVDPTHAQYGQLGELTWHDWRESGMMGVKFADGTEVDFPDGKIEGDQWKPVKSFYRHDNEIGQAFDEDRKAGIEGLKEIYSALNIGGLETLQEKYFEVFGEYIE